MSILEDLKQARDSRVPSIFKASGRKWKKCSVIAWEDGAVYVLAIPLDEWKARHSPTAGQPGIMLPRIVALDVKNGE